METLSQPLFSPSITFPIPFADSSRQFSVLSAQVQLPRILSISLEFRAGEFRCGPYKARRSRVITWPFEPTEELPRSLIDWSKKTQSATLKDSRMKD